MVEVSLDRVVPALFGYISVTVVPGENAKCAGDLQTLKLIIFSVTLTNYHRFRVALRCTVRETHASFRCKFFLVFSTN